MNRFSSDFGYISHYIAFAMIHFIKVSSLAAGMILNTNSLKHVGQQMLVPVLMMLLLMLVRVVMDVLMLVLMSEIFKL